MSGPGESPSPEALLLDGQKRAIAARLRIVGQVNLYSVDSPPPPRGTEVLVTGDKGPEVATVLSYPQSPEVASPDSLPSLEGPLTDADRQVREKHKTREKEAFKFCRQKIKEMDLSMKLISVHLTHSGTHTTYYFSAGQRVDFRSLVKALAHRFQTRIEMRQIGVRDAAKQIGGTGICGGELCCSTWLPEFKPISIRMAKDQNLTLNHLKLSGVCGRLRCCLEYEHELYKKNRSGLPRLNKSVLTPQGPGKVRELNVLKRSVRVQLESGETEEFDAGALTPPKSSAPPGPPTTPSPKQRPDPGPAPSAPQSGKTKSREPSKKSEKPVES